MEASPSIFNWGYSSFRNDIGTEIDRCSSCRGLEPLATDRWVASGMGTQYSNMLADFRMRSVADWITSKTASLTLVALQLYSYFGYLFFALVNTVYHFFDRSKYYALATSFTVCRNLSGSCANRPRKSPSRPSLSFLNRPGPALPP